jgi:hypothetical protein
MEKPSREDWAFPFLTYFLSIRNRVKLICYAEGSFISFGWRVVAGFAQIWGVDNFPGRQKADSFAALRNDKQEREADSFAALRNDKQGRWNDKQGRWAAAGRG